MGMPCCHIFKVASFLDETSLKNLNFAKRWLKPEKTKINLDKDILI